VPSSSVYARDAPSAFTDLKTSPEAAATCIISSISEITSMSVMCAPIFTNSTES